jgi:spore germination cell wall hydrolase CwlJ-like protein
MTPLVVCRAPMQFSCWNPGDPNRRKMEDVSLDDPVFAQSLIAAVETFAGLVASPVGDATHYYATGIPCPRWAEGQTLVATINHHTFFEGIA